MNYSKDDVDALTSQNEDLKSKLDQLSISYSDALVDLNSEKFVSEDLKSKLQNQEKAFQDQNMYQMRLLQEKAKQQEEFLWSLRENMQNVNDQYHEQVAEVEHKKKKLQKANKEYRDLQKQFKENQVQLDQANEMLKQKQEVIDQMKLQIDAPA